MSDYQPWIILYHARGGRFASFPLTDSNLAEIRAQVSLQLLQTDINGCQHYIARAKPRAKKARR
jgi:hypothetical protein